MIPNAVALLDGADVGDGQDSERCVLRCSVSWELKVGTTTNLLITNSIWTISKTWLTCSNPDLVKPGTEITWLGMTSWLEFEP